MRYADSLTAFAASLATSDANVVLAGLAPARMLATTSIPHLLEAVRYAMYRNRGQLAQMSDGLLEGIATMIRNTAFAEAFVNAAASAINNKGKQAPWMARTVVDRVTHTNRGQIREPDVTIHASMRTRKEIQRTCKVVV